MRKCIIFQDHDIQRLQEMINEFLKMHNGIGEPPQMSSTTEGDKVMVTVIIFYRDL
jgi:hypothetical protein